MYNNGIPVRTLDKTFFYIFYLPISVYFTCFFYIMLQQETTVSASFETITNDDAEEKKNMDILAESLTQQPNLSQG